MNPQIKSVVVISLLILSVKFSDGSFLHGAPCTARNTAILKINSWHLPKEITKCVDVTGFKSHPPARYNLSNYTQFFDQVEQADTLYSDHMDLDRFPVAIVKRLPNLELIDLSGNHILNLPHKIFLLAPKLDNLLLSDNMVTVSKGKSLFSSPTLKTLSLSNNEISHIYKRTFLKVPALQVLYLDDNKLRSIEPSMFNSLPELKFLHLGRNYLAHIPPKSVISKTLLYLITKDQQIVASDEEEII